LQRSWFAKYNKLLPRWAPLASPPPEHCTTSDPLQNDFNTSSN
jgi:hypothetical protein